MTFRFINDVLGDYTLNLDALQKDTNLYTTMLFQHSGTFFADQNRFGNRDDCTSLFNAFLSLAKSEQASIAVTPEYSCPWNTIRWVLGDVANRPMESKLWALGCESITPAELRALRDEQQNNSVIFHFDDGALNRGVNVLLNPLCYIFNVQDPTTGLFKLVILVQFKTEHMGVWSNDIEQERYIPGTEIYVLRNNPGSVALFTLICSEADNFQISPDFIAQLDHRWDTNPFIILNIQMNPKPSADFFKTFRGNIMNYAFKDIITLNWSSETTDSHNRLFIPYSKSSIVYISADMEFSSEAKFTNNHLGGLYYANRQQRRHVYFLNGKENVFLIAHRKPISGGANPSMVRRSGPVARNNFSWDALSGTFVATQQMNDGLIDFLDHHNATGSVLRNPGISIIDKERLISLSIGEIKIKDQDRLWHTIDKLHTFFLEDDEIIRRMTFTQDLSGTQNRIDYLEKIDTINSVILSDPDLFPINHGAFPNNCDEVRFPGAPFNYKFNLETNDGTHRATVAYIGRSTIDNAEKVLKTLWELFDEDDQSRKRVIVWYKPDVHTILPIADLRKPKANDNSKSKSTSISK